MSCFGIHESSCFPCGACRHIAILQSMALYRKPRLCAWFNRTTWGVLGQLVSLQRCLSPKTDGRSLGVQIRGMVGT
jgi:hypothetical protein